MTLTGGTPYAWADEPEEALAPKEEPKTDAGVEAMRAELAELKGQLTAMTGMLASRTTERPREDAQTPPLNDRIAALAERYNVEPSMLAAAADLLRQEIGEVTQGMGGVYDSAIDDFLAEHNITVVNKADVRRVFQDRKVTPTEWGAASPSLQAEFLRDAVEAAAGRKAVRGEIGKVVDTPAPPARTPGVATSTVRTDGGSDEDFTAHPDYEARVQATMRSWRKPRADAERIVKKLYAKEAAQRRENGGGF